MSAIRILLLGILNDQKPRHGYEVRHLLESWNANNKWSNIQGNATAVDLILSMRLKNGFMNSANSKATFAKYE